MRIGLRQMKCSFATGVVDGIQASFADYFDFVSYQIRIAPTQGVPECRITPILIKPNHQCLLIAIYGLISRTRFKAGLHTLRESVWRSKSSLRPWWPKHLK
jgi:hypothetical protein